MIAAHAIDTQYGMGFVSPAIESHTFPEHTGSWNSHHDHHAEIITKDGCILSVAARLAYPERNRLVITINGAAKTVTYPESSNCFFFSGKSIASVISDIACGLYPRLWTENEEALNQRNLMANKRNKRQRLEDIRAISRNIEIRQKALPEAAA
jgi:hypothetical protein